MNTNAELKLDENALQGLYRYAMALSQNNADAYDLLQSAVEKYWVEITQKGTLIENNTAFVRRIIRNKHIDKLRENNRWRSESYEEYATYDISLATLEQSVISEDLLDKLWSELDTIDRDILYHWAVLGLTTDEASASLEIPRGTLLSRIHRLRKRLSTDFPEQRTGDNS